MMKNKLHYNLYFLIMIPFLLNSNMGYPMGERQVRTCNYNGDTIIKDIIYRDGYDWTRKTYYWEDPTKPPTGENVLIYVRFPEPMLVDYKYYREDIIEYRGIKRLRPKSGQIIVTEGKLDKPYVVIADFVVHGKIPPNIRKIKYLIQDNAYGILCSDAVIVNRWEVLSFKQEDYTPITEFQNPQYVRYYCTAVIFKDSLPEEVINPKKDYRDNN